MSTGSEVRRTGFEFGLCIFQLCDLSSIHFSVLLYKMVLAVWWAQGKVADSIKHCLSSRSVFSPGCLPIQLCAMEGARLGEWIQRQGSRVNIMRQGAMWVPSKAKHYGALAEPSKGRLRGLT